MFDDLEIACHPLPKCNFDSPTLLGFITLGGKLIPAKPRKKFLPEISQVAAWAIFGRHLGFGAVDGTPNRPNARNGDTLLSTDRAVGPKVLSCLRTQSVGLG